MKKITSPILQSVTDAARFARSLGTRRPVHYRAFDKRMRFMSGGLLLGASELDGLRYAGARYFKVYTV